MRRVITILTAVFLLASCGSDSDGTPGVLDPDTTYNTYYEYPQRDTMCIVVQYDGFEETALAVDCFETP